MLNMGFMLDTLAELDHLSLKLQDWNITLSEIYHKYQVLPPRKFYENVENEK
jgi:hypothetical protein